MADGETRLFDLNIEEVLESWEVHHALREVISNALDEQVLSHTAEIEISKDAQGNWAIRDFGRGLRIEHFTLNENKEKLEAESGVIGKFGVGLKDALATFHRRGIGVEIRSRFGTFELAETPKHGFADITTLHVSYEPGERDMAGTEFVFTGVTDDQMDAAKRLFLRFNDERVLETTRYGQVLDSPETGGRVYISGVFAADEPEFLFSYNVTHLTDAMRKRLNRERLNVGRTTYADRVKQILNASTSDPVLDGLVDALRQRTQGQVPDELRWIEIAQMALTRLDAVADVLFVTDQELHRHPDIVDYARADGLEIVIVSGAEKQKLVAQADSGGTPTRFFERYVQEFNESFSFTFVEEDDLDDSERRVLGLTPDILGLIGVPERRRPKVLISETMRITGDDTHGVWDPKLRAVVIKRSQLGSRADFAGTLLHEVAHALTGAADATREFEGVLTEYLGMTSGAALE